jgi:hypothetical protein
MFNINLIELYNRYFRVYSVKKVHKITRPCIVRKSVDTYEKYIPSELLKLNDNPLQ